MSHILVRQGYQQAKQLLLIQALILVVLSSLGLFKEFKVALALLSGGMAVYVANLYFVYKAFSQSGARASKQVMRGFYLGESVKIVLSAGLVAIAFKLMSGFEVYVLIGYAVILLSQWLAPAIIKTH